MLAIQLTDKAIRRIVATMRLSNPIWIVLYTIFAAVCAKSATGDRLLVVLEDTKDKDLYSQLWADLQCRDYYKILMTVY
jgi:hypothetical protein